MKTILLTGATGFLGTHILNLLVTKKDKYSIAIVTRSYKKTIDRSINQIIFNGDGRVLEKELKEFQPEVVIHLASFLTANDGYEDIDKILDSNIIFGTKLLRALSKTKIKYFINTGSFAEYYKGNNCLDPAYLYAASKTAFRHIVSYYSKKSDFRVINVIPYSIYGDNDKNKKIIDYLIDSIESSTPIKMTLGLQVLDFINVDDVAEFYIKLISNLEHLSSSYNNFHVGTGIGTSIKELASIIEQKTGKQTNISWGARQYRQRDVMRAVADISNTCEILNWEPTTNISDGINSLLTKKRYIL